MASTAMLNLYSSWDKFPRNDHVSLDEDESVSLSSYRRLPCADQKQLALQAATAGIITPPKEKKRYAVEINDASYYHLSGGGKRVQAMKSISLKVPVGEIYGLLGPSGCGKTTMLRCLVGRLSLESGSMKVFGEEVSSACTLGSRVGYMPQEIALFPDFTIEETLTYFARLFNMTHKSIQERIKFLLAFLDLPDKTRLVGNLSGGQKRRVSLAVSLIHSPPLLILDEPTVGVDPVLRQSIWDYLVTLTKEDDLTVIITTHYIEEARAANVVGLMRFGRLLIEASPQYLLQRYQMNTLEEVFLKLCQLDALNQSFKLKRPTTGQSLKVSAKRLYNSLMVPSTRRSRAATAGDADLSTLDTCSSVVAHTPIKTPSKTSQKNQPPADENANIVTGPETPVSLVGRSLTSTTDTPRSTGSTNPVLPSHRVPWVSRTACKTSALFNKNLIRLRRNLPVLLFQFLLPSIEVIIFCICIGRDPLNIPVAIYNEEANMGTGNFSTWFLSKLDNRTIHQVPHSSMQSALDSVKSGKAWGAMAFGANFTDALQMRVMLAGGADNLTIESSNVQVSLDMTNQIIGYQLQRSILYAWRDFSADVSSSMGQNPDAFEFPIQFATPVYGGHAPSFTEFMAPGVLLSISFLAAVALTALAFVMERKEGLLERSLVAGVTSLEFLLSHVLTQLLVLAVQICLLLIFTFCVFHISSEGPFIWVVLLTALQGVCGMSYGLMISALCKEENSATMLALGSFYPNLLLSGTVWPVQAMPSFMKSFSYFLPQTIPVESMRYILSRGWDPTYPEVANGFLVTIAWTSFFLVSAVVIFQWKK